MSGGTVWHTDAIERDKTNLIKYIEFILMVLMHDQFEQRCLHIDMYTLQLPCLEATPLV